MTSQLRVFSFGGGTQSTAALVLAARGEIDFRRFIFANVGEDSENPRTLEYITEHAKPYAERHGIELIEVRKTKRNGATPTLYQLLLSSERSLSIPMYSGDGGPLQRNCTSDFKVRVIARWLKKQGRRRNPLQLPRSASHLTNSTA